METKTNPNQDIDFPNGEIKYQQNVEEMKKLIPLIKEEMRSSPNESLIFSLIETVDFYSLKRSFKLKTTPQFSSLSEKDVASLNKFKNQLLSNISCLDSFIMIPPSEEENLKLKTSIPNSKGSQFKSPKVYDINGDENEISLFNSDTLIFIYNNERDLELFIQKLKSIDNDLKNNIVCLSVDMNFFEHKKFLKLNNLVNENVTYYFADYEFSSSNINIGLKLTSLPRIVLVNSEGNIVEDKCVKNIYSFNIIDVYNGLIEKNNRYDEEKKNDNFILLENDNKRKVIKAINLYIKKAGLNDAHFYVKSKVEIDKNGRRKTKCSPAFYGDSNREGIIMIENLIQILNGQNLFHDIQNKVNLVNDS